MKKYLRKALIFAIYGLCCGVYFREFTKLNNFNSRTMLGMAHPHVLGLGLAGFLLIALFVKVLNIELKKTRFANIMYTIGIIITSVMMLLRGTMEVMGSEISSAMSGMIAGIAGIGHILTAVGIVSFIVVFIKSEQDK